MNQSILFALAATVGTWAVTALGAATVVFFRHTNQKVLNLMLGFACKVKKADFTLSDEVETAEWFLLHIAVNKLRDGSIAQLLLKEYINERE